MKKPLKLLYLNYEFPPLGGGGGTTCKILSEQMVKLGHQVYILTGGIQGNLGISTPLIGLTVERLNTTRKRADLCSKIEQIIYVLHTTAIFKNRLRQFAPDVVHVFFSFPTGGVLWLHRYFMKQPYLISLLGGDVPGFLPEETDFYHNLIKPFTLGLWRNAAAVVPNSQRLGNLARNTLDIPLPVITNGFDASLFVPSARGKSNTLRLIFVGRLVPQKGLDLLLEALAIVKDHLSSWHLSIVGDGPEKSTYQALAEHNGLAKNVDWLGWVPLESLPQIYNSHDLFVLPSRYEGMPSVVVQAMACGCAILACDVFGIDELITEGETGRIAPINNPLVFAEKLMEMVKTDDLAAMGHTGSEKSKSFSNEIITQQYESLYYRSLCIHDNPS